MSASLPCRCTVELRAFCARRRKNGMRCETILRDAAAEEPSALLASGSSLPLLAPNIHNFSTIFAQG
eukprot:6461836-Prymnesium_polylepis.1